jgi:hypothetical protein
MYFDLIQWSTQKGPPPKFNNQTATIMPFNKFTTKPIIPSLQPEMITITAPKEGIENA